MKIKPECIPCIINVRCREIIESKLSSTEKIYVMKDVIKKILELSSPKASTVYVASEAFRLVKKLTKSNDPYKEFKEKSYKVARNLIPLLLEKIRDLNGYKKFRFAAISSINANSLDPGVSNYKFSVSELNKIIFDQRIELDELDIIYEKIKKSRTIIYLLDNTGEAIFDKVLMKIIKSLGVKIYAIVKGQPYQNDITRDEAYKIGLNEVAEVIDTKSDYSGLIPGTYPDEIDKIISNSDLVIAKGMAHYETFLYTPIKKDTAFLLKAKCKPVASTLKVPVGSKIAILRKNSRTIL